MLTGLCLVLLLTGGVVPTRFVDLPYQEIAQSYLASHEMGELRPGDGALDSLLRHAFVSVQLGAFDVRYPARFLGEKKKAGQFQELCQMLLDLQERWLEITLDPTVSKRKVKEPDLDTLSKWVRSWSTGKLGKSTRDRSESHDLLDLLGARDRVREASGSFAEFMRSGRCLDLEWVAPRSVQLAFAPEREDFVGFACFVGTISNQAQAALWQKTLPVWSQFRWDDLQVLALEYAAPGQAPGQFDQGLDMNAREQTGLLQHVGQHGVERLLALYCAGSLDSAFELGLSIDLVIDVLGENNARAGGSGEGVDIGATSKFVPGAGKGGSLPPANADSRWRHSKGRDRYEGILKQTHREGLKLAEKEEDRLPRGAVGFFPLESRNDPSDKHVVQAPFFGEDVGDKDVTDDCLGDYREFFRSYASAFAHWVRTEADPKPDAPWSHSPETAFAQLLRAAAHSNSFEGLPFEELVVEVYGVPFSGPDRESDSLEWQFLTWLSR